MTRYQALRRIGCDPLVSGGIAFLNWLCGVPAGLICFMCVVIEFDPGEQA